jgi:hypothetical protein
MDLKMYHKIQYSSVPRIMPHLFPIEASAASILAILLSRLSFEGGLGY